MPLLLFVQTWNINHHSVFFGGRLITCRMLVKIHNGCMLHMVSSLHLSVHLALQTPLLALILLFLSLLAWFTISPNYACL